MFTVLVVFLFALSLPLPGLVMYTVNEATASSKYNRMAREWAATAAFAVALSIQVCVIEHTRSVTALLIAGTTLAFNLITFQGIGEEEEN